MEMDNYSMTYVLKKVRLFNVHKVKKHFSRSEDAYQSPPVFFNAEIIFHLRESIGECSNRFVVN